MKNEFKAFDNDMHIYDSPDLYGSFLQRMLGANPRHEPQIGPVALRIDSCTTVSFCSRCVTLRQSKCSALQRRA